jgi:oxygen-dependent protoporphyrinogen oxidase
VDTKRVAVVGGGIAGLATAFRIMEGARAADARVSITVLESTDRVGGNIQTDRADGFTVEWGPNGFLDNVPSTLGLARDLGLGSELQPADARAAKRFIWRGGRLHALPTGPASFLFSSVLSVPGRMRVFMEPLQPKGPVDSDESVRAFGSRRIGEEAADVLIDAMVSGVFAGDAAALSLPSAFPKMRAMEAEHGSLVKAMVARFRHLRRRPAGAGGGPAGPGGTLTSFFGGMETLPRALADALGPRVRTNVGVDALTRAGDDAWRLHLTAGARLDVDEVVLAVPARAAADILSTLDPALAGGLAEAPTAGLAVVALGVDEAQLDNTPDGFGFLVPRSEGLRMLGCLRDSSIFPGRAPEGQALLRVMIGGAHDPGAVDLDDQGLVDTVLGELRLTVGLTGEPSLARVIRHPLGIAQYNVGHGARIAGHEKILNDLPGLSLAGSAHYGVAMNACVERAGTDAHRVLTRLMEKQNDRISLGT